MTLYEDPSASPVDRDNERENAAQITYLDGKSLYSSRILSPVLGGLIFQEPVDQNVSSSVPIREDQRVMNHTFNTTPEADRHDFQRRRPTQQQGLELVTSSHLLPTLSVENHHNASNLAREKSAASTAGSHLPSPPPEDQVLLTAGPLSSGVSPKHFSTKLGEQNQRPGTGSRSATSPLLQRRESASNSGRRGSRPLVETSRSRRPSLTPIRVSEEFKSSDDAAKSSRGRDGLNHGSSNHVPLPAFSLPTYLQLELAAERPSALYVQRTVNGEFTYASSEIIFERILNFLTLPRKLEQMLLFGALACVDAWLYSFTILPLRFIKALWMFSQWAAELIHAECKLLYERIKHVASAKTNSKQEKASPHLELEQERPLSGIARSEEISSEASSRKVTSSRKDKVPTMRPKRYKYAASSLTANHKADLLHGMLIVVSCILLNRFDASRVYHFIRGQSAIKLYVIYSVLEICDRLFSALGQDILECLFSKETLERKSNGRSKIMRPIWMFLLALIYNVIHSTALFYQVVALNVAVNSYSNALLTLLLSNQFAEVKSTVFKKFEKENLFQLACADIVERFQLWLMLSIIASRNIVEVGGLSFSQAPLSSRMWQTGNTTASAANESATNSGPWLTSMLVPAAFSYIPALTWPILTPFLIVLGSELLVDWLKHAYIAKFNSVKPSVYSRFLDVLAKDYYAHAFADQNLTRRLGLPTVPLACLTIRAAFQVWGMFVAANFPSASSTISPITSPSVTILSEVTSETVPALHKIDLVIRRALGNSAFGNSSDAPWTTRFLDTLIAYSTTIVFFLLLYLFLLAVKLVLGMLLLNYSRSRYMGIKKREREIYSTHAKPLGGLGTIDVDDEKRKIIYEDDDAGLKAMRAREQKSKRSDHEPDTLKLDNIDRYSMAAKRIW